MGVIKVRWRISYIHSVLLCSQIFLQQNIIWPGPKIFLRKEWYFQSEDPSQILIKNLQLKGTEKISLTADKNFRQWEFIRPTVQKLHINTEIYSGYIWRMLQMNTQIGVSSASQLLAARYQTSAAVKIMLNLVFLSSRAWWEPYS